MRFFRSMKLFPLFIAAFVAFVLYALVFERDSVMALAQTDTTQAETAAKEEVAPAVGVLARASKAQPVDSAVVLRGRTEAARQVDVRAETNGRVISPPLRKGAFVAEGEIMCQLDPGTRAASLLEAQARLAEAQGRVPEAEARLQEAIARLEEARINDNAANKLSQDGFASTTRVATTQAGVRSAEAGVQSAKSGVQSAKSGIQSAQSAVANAETEISRLEIKAPFAGLLESDTAELGSLMQPGGHCATIIQLDPIKLVGFVPETEVSRLQLGAQAGARLTGGTEVQGLVTFLSRSADSETRTFRVEIEVPNDDLAIRDGQTAEILISADGASAHLLPSSSLTLNDAGTLGVRIIDDASKALFIPVTMIRDTANGVLLTGLPDEANVIILGQEYVTDGVPVAPTYEEILQ